MPSGLHIPAWRERLTSYHDKQLCDFLEFGWPIGYTKPSPPQSSSKNHGSALACPDIIDAFLAKECSLGATCGPFSANPLATPLITSPLQIATSRFGKPRVVLDLSFPQVVPLTVASQRTRILTSLSLSASQAQTPYRPSFASKAAAVTSSKRTSAAPTDSYALTLATTAISDSPTMVACTQNRPSIRSPLSHDDVPAHHFRGHFHVQFPRFCLYELHRRLRGR